MDHAFVNQQVIFLIEAYVAVSAEKGIVWGRNVFCVVGYVLQKRVHSSEGNLAAFAKITRV